MQPEVLGGMVFTLLLGLMVGGFILVYPLTRQLGKLLESRLQEKKPVPRAGDAEIAALRETIAELNNTVERLADRQDFMEKLLARKTDPRGLAAPGSE